VPQSAQTWQFPLIWVVGTAFILGVAARLKRVRIDDDALYISNYLKEISVPFSAIADVTEFGPSFLSIRGGRPAIVHFREPTDFGHRIIFIPEGSTGMSAGPIVGELKRLAVAQRILVSER